MVNTGILIAMIIGGILLFMSIFFISESDFNLFESACNSDITSLISSCDEVENPSNNEQNDEVIENSGVNING